MPSRRARSPEVNPPVPQPDRFSRFAHAVSDLAGRPVAFFSAAGLVILWAASGPLFGFGESWQLTINTLTTIVTFLMVFLIQNTQNRDTLALQVKLAELILHMRGAPDEIADAEDMSVNQLERLHEQYKARARHRKRKAAKKKRRA